MTFSIITVSKEIIDSRLEELQRHLWVQLPIAAACGSVVVVVVVPAVDLTVIESLQGCEWEASLFLWLR